MPKHIKPAIRLRIIQIRASNPASPPTIDAIIEKLSPELANPDDVPARGSINTIIRAWEVLDEEIRFRDIPFVWHQLEWGRVPWEASRWVLGCQAWLERKKVQCAIELSYEESSTEDITFLLDCLGPFTNRWATWVWRVHQARPDLDTERVCSIAPLYIYAEQAQDFLPGGPTTYFPSGLQEILAHQPDRFNEEVKVEDTEKTEEFGFIYGSGLEFGIIKPPPSPEQLDSLMEGLESAPNVDKYRSIGAKLGAMEYVWWFNSWSEPLAKYMDELRGHSETEETTDARTPEAKIQG